MQLYNITENLKQIEQMIEDGVDPSQLQDAIKDIDEAFEEKAGHILFLMRNIEANIDMVKDEEKRLASKRKAMENQHESIKDYLIKNMADTGKTKIDNGVIKASYVKPKPMLDLIDPDLVPDDYKQPQVTIKLDKTLLLNDLKDGKEVAGAAITESKAGLRIS